MIRLFGLLFVLASSLAVAQPSTLPCTPGKTCRPYNLIAGGAATTIPTTTGLVAAKFIDCVAGGGGFTCLRIQVNDSIQWGSSGVGLAYDGTQLKVTGTAHLTPSSNEAIHLGTATLNFSYGFMSRLTYGSASTPLRISSSMSAANATATNPSVLIAPENALGANDAVARVCDSTSTNCCTVDQEGDMSCTGTVASGSGTLSTAAGAINNYWSSVCFGVCSEDTNMTGGIRAQGTGTTNRLLCSWGTAGTGGSTGVELNIFDVTAAGTLCTCNLGACTIAANTPTVCTCSGTYVNNNLYTMQLRGTTDCAVNPSNIVCTAMVGP